MKKRIWRKIVIQKIENQARCLELNEANADDVALVRSVSNTVVDGDEHNGEAVAAKNYFKVLFGQSFKRWSPVNKIDNLNRDFFVLCHD